MRLFSLLVLTLAACLAQAEVRPFEVGSHAQIRTVREGRPFILSFWSIDCAHCPKELRTLGELKKRHPGIDIVLVSTDPLAETAMLANFAARQGLGQAEQWVFADPQPQKLRFEIDKRWWGELPRTYLFDADHKVVAFSGLMAEDALAGWVERNGLAARRAGKVAK